MRILLSLATAITILAAALVLLLTPVWTHFALGAAGSIVCTADVCTGADGAEVVPKSDLTVDALLFTGDFSFPGVNGPANAPPFYTEAEQSHMRDVRVVFYGFMLLAIVSVVFVVSALFRARLDAARWSAVARGGIWLIVAMVILGVFAFVAFDTVFLLFHEIFFPAGNFDFPADSNLIRLYPEPFWELSSTALFVLTTAAGLIVWFLARRRAAALTRA